MRLKKGSTVSAGRKRPILPLNIVNENGLIWNWRKPIHAFGYEDESPFPIRRVWSRSHNVKKDTWRDLFECPFLRKKR